MKYSKVLAALAFSAIISAESVALEPVRHTVFSTSSLTGSYNPVGAAVNIKVSIYDNVNSTNLVYQETHAVTVNSFGFLQFEIGSGVAVSGSFGGGLTPSLIVKTYVMDGETERLIDTKRMSEIIYNANVSRYSHTVGMQPDPALSGASVISQIQIDANGVLTTTNRDLTPEDIAAAPAVHRHDNATAGTLETPGVDGYMSATDKAKLDGVAAGAEENVNADWNAAEGDAQILNKPTTIAGYGITDAASKTELADGLLLKVDKEEGKSLMTDAERTKLAGIEEGATNYQHPLTHPATMIVEDETHRFVTDTEKATWSGKLDNSLNRGYVFIGDAQNKPVATLGGEGEVLMSNGVYNGFGKVKNANIADNAAIAGTKITPDFGTASVITGGVLNVSEINVLAANPFDGGISAEGIIASEGGFEGTSLTVTGAIAGENLMISGSVDVPANSLEIADVNGLQAAIDAQDEGLAIIVEMLEDVDAKADANATAIAAEVTRATEAEAGLQTAIAAEVTRATGEEGLLRADVETNTALIGDLADIIADVDAKADANADAIAAEVTRATEAEAGLDAEIEVHGTMIGALVTAVDAIELEQDTQDELIATNVAAIAAEQTRAEGIEDGLRSDVDNNTEAITTLSDDLVAIFDAVAEDQTRQDNDIANKLDNKLPLNQVWIGNGIADADPSATAGLIADANIADGAAINGTKIAPNFGAQNVVTTANVTANEFNTTNGATAGLRVGETLGTAWANVNKDGNAVLEMGLGLAADGTTREGYGITINDDAANHRATLGKTPFGWSAGVQGTTAAAGAVTTGGADAKLVVMNGVNEVFSADQDGKIAAAELALTAKATSAATVVADDELTLTTKGYVDAKVAAQTLQAAYTAGDATINLVADKGVELITDADINVPLFKVYSIGDNTVATFTNDKDDSNEPTVIITHANTAANALKVEGNSEFTGLMNLVAPDGVTGESVLNIYNVSDNTAAYFVNDGVSNEPTVQVTNYNSGANALKVEGNSQFEGNLEYTGRANFMAVPDNANPNQIMFVFDNPEQSDNTTVHIANSNDATTEYALQVSHANASANALVVEGNTLLGGQVRLAYASGADATMPNDVTVYHYTGAGALALPAIGATDNGRIIYVSVENAINIEYGITSWAVGAGTTSTFIVINNTWVKL